MGIVDRVKNILLTPKTEWPVIAGETPSTGELMGGYVAPLAGISVICGFIGSSLIGTSLPFMGTFRTPIVAGIGVAVFSFAMAFVGIFILSLIINALAPTFGGEKSSAQAMKVAVYSYTPAWIAGILGIIPALGLIGLLVSLYGLYLLYLGLPRLMKNPEEKSLGYTAVVVVCAIVIGFLITLAASGVAMLTGGGAMMGAMHGGPGPAFDRDSPMGKLEGFGKQMEAVGRKMEAAQQSGDPNAQMKAAMEGLGTMLGGGKRFEPVSLDQLKPLVPESFAGLPRTEQGSERGGPAGLQMAKAEARYGDGAGRRVELVVTDTGGAGGLLGLAGWMNVQGERERNGRVERTRREGDRTIHEEISKGGSGANEFTVVLGDRFIVSAKGRGVAFEDLKSGVASLDLGRLESMKNAGAQQ